MRPPQRIRFGNEANKCMQGHHKSISELTRQWFLHLAKVNIIEWKCSQITSAVTIQQVCNRGPATSAKIANITKNCKNFKWSNIQRRLKNSKSGLENSKVSWVQYKNSSGPKNSITKKIQKYAIQYSKLDQSMLHKKGQYAPNAPYNAFLGKDTIVLGVYTYCSVYVRVVPNGATE